MQAATSPARQTRSHYRHELRTLTYVTLDDGNAGIIRNMNHTGVAVQAVGRLHAEQIVRLRFELRFPRLRVEARGRVTWANPSGQCGIRFVDLPERSRQEIDQWIFSNLLDSIARTSDRADSIFASSLAPFVPEEDDGLILSPTQRGAIRIQPEMAAENENDVGAQERIQELLEEDAPRKQRSGPMPARTLAWIVDGLVMVAAVLLFALVFLSITHELPQWPLALAGSVGATALIAGAYWGLFALCGGSSIGVRVAQLGTARDAKITNDETDRFR
jgi:PilZ domain